MEEKTLEVKALDEIYEALQRFGKQSYTGMKLGDFNHVRDLLEAIQQALLNSGHFSLKANAT